jgi:homocysteine S-methyltransferase
MSQYRQSLPQLRDAATGHHFMTDGGLETTLIFHDGIELPYFAAFHLLRTAEGVEVLRRYYERYARMAVRNDLGLILEAPTWRANPDWGTKLGYDAIALADANRRAIGLMLEIRAAHETPESKMVISGNLGPRGDGYRAGNQMTIQQAADYHAVQIEVFAATDADLVSAFTMTYVEEAIGIVQAAESSRIPAVISFTLETDGRLPSGTPLGEAIAHTDEATGGYPAYYMINCAHPTHFMHVLGLAPALRERIRGVRANASRRSHSELDESVDLDVGNPDELGHEHVRLRGHLPKLAVVGGCCGTDHRHVAAIVRSLHGPTSRAVPVARVVNG